ncbi:MAG: response regulator [Blastocatellia bacterium]
MDELHVLIADEQPIFRLGVRGVIEQIPDVRVVAEAGDGPAALDGVAAFNPHLVILDIDLPGMDGWGVARAILEQRPPISIVFLTARKDERSFNEALALGARGYLTKAGPLSDLVDCLHAVASGERYISPAMPRLLLASKKRSPSAGAADLETITPAERRVLGFLAMSKTSKEIASELGVSSRTIDNHRANLCAKLGLHNPHALARFAIANRERLLR